MDPMEAKPDKISVIKNLTTLESYLNQLENASSEIK